MRRRRETVAAHRDVPRAIVTNTIGGNRSTRHARPRIQGRRHVTADPHPPPLRANWNGHPVDLGDAWPLHKGTKVASHEFGWELRLMVGELVRSQVCRWAEEILTMQEAWKAAMTGKGWS